MMMIRRLPRPSRRSAPRCGFIGGFSLVEVTLALGVISFGLVAVLGVLPVALTTSRASVAQTRAAELAETVFTGLRAEPFTAASPGRGLEGEEVTPPPDFNLATFGAPSGGAVKSVTVYAVLTETEVSSATDPRRLRFTANSTGMNTLLQNAAGKGAAASGYQLAFTFNAQPEGTFSPGLANRLLLIVRPAVGTADAFSFTTLIANRGS